MKPLVDIIVIGAKPIKGMKSLGAFSNIKIDKKHSILDSQIYNLRKKINVNNIIYVGGFQVSKIHNDDIIILSNDYYDQKNNGTSLKLALDHCKSDYIFILFNKTLFSHKIFNRFDYSSSYVFINDAEINNYSIGCTIQNDKIENLFYNLPNKIGGLYGLSKTEINILKKIDIQDNWFIFEIMNHVISAGGTFIPKYISDSRALLTIDNNVILKKIKRYYAQNFNI